MRKTLVFFRKIFQLPVFAEEFGKAANAQEASELFGRSGVEVPAEIAAPRKNQPSAAGELFRFLCRRTRTFARAQKTYPLFVQKADGLRRRLML
ncbi:MAG: hypothetical protein IKW50_06300 [Oscillospiraceae bacterium]|nr:hypothetical protein [Oscillospiraceae bacterium]